jgi:hypothetical protein
VKKDGGSIRRNGHAVSALIRSEIREEQFWDVLNFSLGKTDGAGIGGKVWQRENLVVGQFECRTCHVLRTLGNLKLGITLGNLKFQ